MSERDSYIRARLTELCQEVLGWKKTGVLPGNFLRELASRHFSFVEYGGLQLAEEAVKVAAMRFAIESAKTAEGHEPTTVPVASGAGYIRCSCGWRSEVEDDGTMFEEGRYNARAAFEAHLKADGPKVRICLSCGHQEPLTAEIIANASTTCQACGESLRPIPQ